LLRHNPFADPEPLVQRVYAYVAYRLGQGPDADDVTNDVFEQALRYRDSYNEQRGEPIAWLLGIARRRVAFHLQSRREIPVADVDDLEAVGDLEGDTVSRLALQRALETLGERDRELIALHYGADLGARRIGRILEMETNAVEVALHRARARLRIELTRPEITREAPPAPDAQRAVPQGKSL
jgi:RNA polymerase sigma factor (sigma-70 family)